jgi:hypothetical protein
MPIKYGLLSSHIFDIVCISYIIIIIIIITITIIIYKHMGPKTKLLSNK